MPQNIDDTQDSNPNFDKEYYKRETEKLDFADQEDISNTDFMDYFEKMERIQKYAGDPSTQVKHIEDGT